MEIFIEGIAAGIVGNAAAGANALGHKEGLAPSVGGSKLHSPDNIAGHFLEGFGSSPQRFWPLL